MIYDVCVIGSGAGAGPIIYELSNAGLKVCVLEKGDIYNEKDFSKDEIVAPCDGTVKPLSEVNDDVFSQEIMGKGIAIEPSTGNLYAPCDGTITVCFPTGHAIGLKSKNGTEILMHVGIDTVNLQGKYFSPQIQVNEEVKKGQLLLTFDLAKIKEEGYDTTTPIIITNSKNFSSLQFENDTTIQHGNKLISLA